MYYLMQNLCNILKVIFFVSIGIFSSPVSVLGSSPQLL